MSKVIFPEPGSQLTIGSTTVPDAPRPPAGAAPDTEPWAWAVYQPLGAEFDYLVYPNRDDAERDSQVIDGDAEMIQLFPRSPSESALLEAARELEALFGYDCTPKDGLDARLKLERAAIAYAKERKP